MAAMDENQPTREAGDEQVRRDPLDPAQQNISDGTRALEAAYRSREVTFSMFVVGIVVVIGLVVALVAFTLASGAGS